VVPRNPLQWIDLSDRVLAMGVEVREVWSCVICSVDSLGMPVCRPVRGPYTYLASNKCHGVTV
jgi:hypothetical protein